MNRCLNAMLSMYVPLTITIHRSGSRDQGVVTQGGAGMAYIPIFNHPNIFWGPSYTFFWADQICHPIWPIPGSVTASPYNISSNSGPSVMFYVCFVNKKIAQFPTTHGFMKQTLNPLTWNSTWGNYQLWKQSYHSIPLTLLLNPDIYFLRIFCHLVYYLMDRWISKKI